MRDLEEMAEKLLESARKLPPGLERLEFMREIETFRARIAAIAAKQEHSQPNRASRGLKSHPNPAP
jgi:hypothetical protein